MKLDVNRDIGHGGCGGFDGVGNKIAPEAVAVPVGGARGREGLCGVVGGLMKRREERDEGREG